MLTVLLLTDKAATQPGGLVHMQHLCWELLSTVDRLLSCSSQRGLQLVSIHESTSSSLHQSLTIFSVSDTSPNATSSTLLQHP